MVGKQTHGGVAGEDAALEAIGVGGAHAIHVAAAGPEGLAEDVEAHEAVYVEGLVHLGVEGFGLLQAQYMAGGALQGGLEEALDGTQRQRDGGVAGLLGLGGLGGELQDGGEGAAGVRVEVGEQLGALGQLAGDVSAKPGTQGAGAGAALGFGGHALEISRRMADGGEVAGVEGADRVLGGEAGEGVGVDVATEDVLQLAHDAGGLEGLAGAVFAGDP